MKLTKKEQKALDEFTQKLTSKYADRIDRIVLYGSRARGDARPDSDIDLLIVVKDKQPRVIDNWGLERVTDWEVEWEKGYPVEQLTRDLSSQAFFDYGIDFSPHIVDTERYYDHWNPFLASVRNEGRDLWKRI
ncbi:MAG: nucleotidyltransferase domain-containing protein [Candidatus Cloacimonetes bacterium]|nr:nucleotidyltransferase domain-containing protein [Candidatus Cloacimonadota bacterium]